MSEASLWQSRERVKWQKSDENVSREVQVTASSNQEKSCLLFGKETAVCLKPQSQSASVSEGTDRELFSRVDERRA